MAISRGRFRGWFVRGSVLAIALPALLAGPIAVATGLVVPSAMPFLVLGFLLSVLTLIASYSTRVEVGDDGVLVAPVLGRSTFVPIAEIERAEPNEGLRIRLHLRSGAMSMWRPAEMKTSANPHTLRVAMRCSRRCESESTLTTKRSETRTPSA